MHSFVIRATAAALVVLALDEGLKRFVRSQLASCPGPALGACQWLEVGGSVWLVRTGNAGSIFGFAPGWWLWLALAEVSTPSATRTFASIGCGLEKHDVQPVEPGD
jgi:hypothetical protein